MRELLQKRSTQVIMVLLVLIIWIYNMNQIISIQSESENVSRDLDLGDVDTFQYDQISTYNYTYNGDFKDPFLPAIRYEQTPATPPESIAEQPEPVRPRVQLFGIVEESAVVKIANENVHFMQNGDQIEGVRLQVIYSDSVTFTFNEETFTLNLK